MNRHAGSRGVGGAAGDAGVRQVGAAGPELQPLELETEAVHGDLRERSPGALAHVLSTELEGAGPVTPQDGSGLALEHDGWEGRGAETPTDQQPVFVAHLPRRQGAPCPAKARRTLRVALAQRLGGERLAGDRLDLGVILETEFQRSRLAACAISSIALSSAMLPLPSPKPSASRNRVG
jgi:hypothetical protein